MNEQLQSFNPKITKKKSLHLTRTIFHTTALCQEQRNYWLSNLIQKDTFKLGVS